jgi:hypothetical protein
MALPEILVPAGIPVFKEAGHSHRRRSVYRDVQMGTGHMRKRARTTTAPRVVTVEWFLRPNQELTVDAWFENDLKVGSEKFSAQLARIGGRFLMWWECQWVSPMAWTPLANGYWRVTGELLLTGDGSLTAPVVTTAAVEFGVILTGSATAVVINAAESEFGIALTQFSSGAAEFGITLMQFTPAALVDRITEDAQTRTTETGETRILE